MLYYNEHKRIGKYKILKNIIIINNKSNKIQVGRYYKFYYKDEKLKEEEYWINDKLHNPNGPALKLYYEDGFVVEEYYINGDFLTKEEFEDWIK